MRMVSIFAALAATCATSLVHSDSLPTPIITQAGAASANTMLHVAGANLNGGAATLTLGSSAIPLAITSNTATQIDALLPAGIQPGSYLLTLTLTKQNNAGVGEVKIEEFWVTLGAAGPVGPAGPQGPPGPAGSDTNAQTAAAIFRIDAVNSCGTVPGTLTTEPRCVHNFYLFTYGNLPPSPCRSTESSHLLSQYSEFVCYEYNSDSTACIDGEWQWSAAYQCILDYTRLGRLVQ